MGYASPPYTVAVYEGEPDEGGFWAEVLDLPGCVAQGETLDELRRNILSAIQAWEGTRADMDVESPPHRVFTWSLPVQQDADEHEEAANPKLIPA